MGKLNFATVGVNINNKGKADEIATPMNICNDMVELFPKESFKDTSKIWADIYCKTGNTLKALKQYGVSKENIIAICPTPQSQLFACRQLYGKLLPEVKIDRKNRYSDVVGVFNITRRGQVYYISNWKEIVTGKVSNTNALTIINKIILNEMRSEMSLEFTSENGFKFNNIIMNPPYNNDMYLDFVTLAHKLATDNVVAITPAKWQAKGGEKNEVFRRDIVPYMSNIVYYPDCIEVFGISENSGITYFITGKNICEIKKIENKAYFQPLVNGVVNRKLESDDTLWNIGQQIIDKIGQCNKYQLNIINEDARKQYTICVGKQWCGSRVSSGAWDMKTSRIKEEYVGKGGCIFNPSGNIKVLGKVIGLTSTQYDTSNSSIYIFTSDSKDESLSFYSWICSKFISFLVLINLSGSIIFNDNTLKYIPVPQSFDHIFTDQELYKEYNLTPEEINIIESVIK